MKRLLLLLPILCAAAPAQELKFAADRPVDLLHLRLEGTIDLEAQTFEGTALLDFTPLRRLRDLRLDAVALDVKRIDALGPDGGDQKPLEFANTGTELQIRLPNAVERGKTCSLRITYAVHKPEKGLYFFRPTEAEPDVPFQAWTQGETHEARHWIPIIDQPNERLTTELIIHCDAKYRALSNGRRVAMQVADGLRTVHWKQEKDHVPYLITLVVGEFAVLEEEWRGKQLSYWVPPDREADAMRSFANTKRMLDYFSDSLGVAYPWDKYAQVVVEQFGWGGMENTSATTLNERTLHDERAHLDTSSDGLVAHELAHQWFGDLLTCKDWAHTWLNEGFASYFEALWNGCDRGEDEFRYNMRGKAQAAMGGGKDKPIVWRGYKSPWEQFDARAYPKGAWVLHMIRRRLGDEAWWRALHHYVTKHAHGCVETQDLRVAIEEATGGSFGRFFYDWTERPGHPVVAVRHRWQADKGLMEVHVRQTQKQDAFHFPLRLEYEVAGTRLGITHDVTEKESTVMVPLPARPTLVRVDPAYAVLMELTEDKARDWWLNQLRSDPDVVARIRAAEHFAAERNDAARTLLAAAFAAEQAWPVRAELAAALGRAGAHAALLAAVGTPHPKVRRAVVEAIGRFRERDDVRTALAAIVANGDPSYSVEAAAVAAWAGLRPDGGVAALQRLLPRESHNDIVREAVLRGLGDQQDPAALDALLSWTRRGRPRGCRTAALDGLARVAKGGRLDDAQVARVVDAAQLCLHRLEHANVKTQAAQLLRDLGAQGSAALPALAALAEQDPDERVRKQAQEAREKIEAGAPAIVQLDRLRKRLAELEARDRQRRAQLEQLERKQPQPVK